MGAEASAASPVAFLRRSFSGRLSLLSCSGNCCFRRRWSWSVLAGYLLLPSDRVVGIDSSASAGPGQGADSVACRCGHGGAGPASAGQEEAAGSDLAWRKRVRSAGSSRMAA